MSEIPFSQPKICPKDKTQRGAAEQPYNMHFNLVASALAWFIVRYMK